MYVINHQLRPQGTFPAPPKAREKRPEDEVDNSCPILKATDFATVNVMACRVKEAGEKRRKFLKEE